MLNHHLTLEGIAIQAMKERGFIPEFPNTAERQAAALLTLREPVSSPALRDLSSLFWISIDNDDTLDLDQITFAEAKNGSDTIYIAIADVDAFVTLNSPIDRYAAHNTTSVYTPTRVFPMLPLELSNDLTSLKQDTDRLALVVEIEVAQEGEFLSWNLYPAKVKNQAKLAYNGVANWLEKKEGSYSREVMAQLELQDEIAQRIRAYRFKKGALNFSKKEAVPIVKERAVVGLIEEESNRARQLIENFMIAANVAVSRWHAQNHIPTLRRVVREPKRWDRIVALAKEKGTKLPSSPDAPALRDFLLKQQQNDPDHFPDLSLAIIKLIGRGGYMVATKGEAPIGHFDLALLYYTHATAPNRRFPDLIMQRLTKHFLQGDPFPYTVEELKQIAAHCTQKEDDAEKVQRRVRKSAAAIVLSSKIGKTFPALVTGASEKGVWVRLLTPPIEGKLVEGFQGADVGDKLLVTLISVDIPNGFIDFKKTKVVHK